MRTVAIRLLIFSFSGALASLFFLFLHSLKPESTYIPNFFLVILSIIVFYFDLKSVIFFIFFGSLVMDAYSILPFGSYFVAALISVASASLFKEWILAGYGKLNTMLIFFSLFCIYSLIISVLFVVYYGSTSLFSNNSISILLESLVINLIFLFLLLLVIEKFTFRKGTYVKR